MIQWELMRLEHRRNSENSVQLLLIVIKAHVFYKFGMMYQRNMLLFNGLILAFIAIALMFRSLQILVILRQNISMQPMMRSRIRVLIG